MGNVRPIASIILPSYFRPKTLWLGLYSLAHQKSKYKFEIIVLNDGQPDDTEKVCNYFIKEYKLDIKYKFVGERNLPKPIWRVPGAVFNIGAKMSDSYILILSSPEIFHLHENSVESLIAPLLKNGKLLTIPNGKDDTSEEFTKKVNSLKARNQLTLENCNNLGFTSKELNTKMPFCMGITKQQFMEINGYDKRYFDGFCFDDNDLVDRLIKDKCTYHNTVHTVIHLFNSRKNKDRIGLSSPKLLWAKNKKIYDRSVIERGLNNLHVQETIKKLYRESQEKKIIKNLPEVIKVKPNVAKPDSNFGIEFDIKLKSIKIKVKKLYKPIFHYCVMTTNKGDTAIRSSIERSVHKYLPEVPFAYFNCKGEILTEKRIKQFNDDASLLIIGGSGLYTNYPTDSGWYFPCKTELFSKLKIPIILLGIGNNNNLKNDIFKGNLKPDAEKSIKLINKLASISTVRDERTFDFLNSLGIKKHKLILDPANFLVYPEIKREKRVAINIGQHSPILGRFDGNNKIRNKNILYFSNISNHLIKKGYEVVFISHDTLEQSLIIDLKKYVPKLEYINTDNIDLMLQEYAKCQFSIGVKMHSNIMSFAVGTPFISVYYDKKSIEYLKLLNYSDFGVSIFDNYYKDLKNKTDNLVDNWEQYSDYFKRIKQKEFEKYDEITKQICNIIKEIK